MTRLIEIAGDYDAVLLDAYGVLVDAKGPLEGAPEAVRELQNEGIEYYVVTNDASRLEETVAGRLGGFGIEVDPERVITSGSLLEPFFVKNNLVGSRCFVLGPADSVAYVDRACARAVDIGPENECDAVVVCDEAGFDFLPTVDATLSAIIRQIDAGEWVDLIQPNPDLIYPKGGGSYGFTSGAATLLIEAALERRYPGEEYVFERLGKPNPMLFQEAIERAGSKKLLMVGDQMETDIVGARRAGLDAALLTTGITRGQDAHRDPDTAPTFVLDAL